MNLESRLIIERGKCKIIPKSLSVSVFKPLSFGEGLGRGFYFGLYSTTNTAFSSRLALECSS